MIIWGSTGRQIRLGSGEFFCPNCEVDCDYDHKRSTTYFIPLFQTQNHGEYVECHSCGGTYEMEVLEYEPPTREEMLAAAVREKIESGVPLHMLRRQLSERGLEDHAAESVVDAAVGEHRTECAGCGFEYGSNVSTCSNCGTELDSFFV